MRVRLMLHKIHNQEPNKACFEKVDTTKTSNIGNVFKAPLLSHSLVPFVVISYPSSHTHS